MLKNNIKFEYRIKSLEIENKNLNEKKLKRFAIKNKELNNQSKKLLKKITYLEINPFSNSLIIKNQIEKKKLIDWIQEITNKNVSF